MADGEVFNPGQVTKYIMYLDANNLYGYAMSQLMPTRGFKWLSETEINNMVHDHGKIMSCRLEVDLDYPVEYHDMHNEYPFAAEALNVNGVKKLIPNLQNKRNYVIHHCALKQCLENGLVLRKIHRGIKYEETSFLKEYVDLNTNLCKKSKNKFEKDFFKLMINSVFGKTMENVRCRSNVKIINEKNGKKILGLIARPNLKSVFRYENSDLVSVNMGKSVVMLNKPIYLGQAILDLSKTLMYDFHYNYIKNMYGPRARLLFTDTDSLCYVIETEDFYIDIKKDVPRWFDTSEYPPDHPAGLPIMNK